MQTNAVNNVLEYLQVSFAFDRKEAEKLLGMLHKTLTEAIPILRTGQSQEIYLLSHKLHAELNICGYRELSELATAIELQAKKGTVEQILMADFIARSSAFATEIADWLVHSDS